MKPYRIYISGPITKGDPSHNYKQAADMQAFLLSKGFAVYNAHRSMVDGLLYYMPYKTWITNDLEWLKVSDAVIRLPGYSYGGDIETRDAEARSIPVFYDVNELIEYFEQKDRED